ncbi:MAG: SGNH/GDSL hydrolase family protein [Elusimicrobia bacterium]|nr:SGNH/GDSL hydrolase family protein [Elusimicrobiota bacterium]
MNTVNTGETGCARGLRRILLVLAGLTAAVGAADVSIGLFYRGEISQGIISRYTDTVFCKYGEGESFRVSGELGYELVPGSGPQINSLGMMDREHPVEKKDGTYRILVLGDSVTAAYGVRIGRRYTGILEETLNGAIPGRKKDYEVWNAGFSGYSLVEYVKYLGQKGVGYEPDMVIAGMTFNDINTRGFRVLRIGKKGCLAYRPSSVMKTDLLSFSLCRYSSVARLIAAAVTYKYSKGRDLHNDMIMKNNIKNLVDLKNICMDNGIDLMVMIIPTVLVPEEYRTAHDEIFAVIKEMCGAEKIESLDLREYMDSSVLEDAEMQIQPGDFIHYSEKGHKIIGDILCGYLSDVHRL